MNIAFDATAILGPMSKNRGIGNYALSQFTTMINLDKDNNYFFINFFEEFTLSDYIEDCSNFKEFYFYCGKENFLIREKQYEDVIGDIIKNFIDDYKIDIFYITSPFDGHMLVYRKEWFGKVKTIVTVYDIIPYIFKEYYLNNDSAYKWYMEIVDMLRWVDKYFVISKSVKDDMIKYLNFDSEKIDIIWGAVDEKYQQIKISEEEKSKFFSKFKINSKYIMCTGGDDNRKNIEGLIKAYSNLSKSIIDDFQLVIVCKLSKESFNRYNNLIKKRKILDRVILTNFVSFEELLMFYNLASLMAFPSQYEGFGLPVVEAFACGTPVLTSNNSSLVQIAGDAAVLVDPFDVNDITRGLNEALTKTNLDELVEKGYKQLENFRWNKVAKNAIGIINNLKVFKKDTDKKKIAFFTPLPPIQSGISDYSVDILNEISKYFDIDVFIDDGYMEECKLNDNINVFNHNLFEKKVKNYDNIVYQVGNSEYHIYMWEYIKKYRGIVVLHDYNMHLVICHYNFNLRKNKYNDYENSLLEDYSEKEEKEYTDKLKNGKSGFRIYDMETNGIVVNYAKKIIVHSNEVREKLLRKNVGLNVKTIQHYAKIEKLINSEEKKENLGFDKKCVIMASFGFVHSSKRIMPILYAFKRITEKYDNVKYIFVGKLDAAIKKDFNDYVSKNNLRGCVIVTGYTELDKFLDYMDASDICFNLRYPYNGETSGSLMRLLAKGKCIVINNIGSFGEISDKICIKLPDVKDMSEKEEVDKIYHVMEMLMDENERKNYSENARKYAEENLDLKIIGKKYADYINENEKNGLSSDILYKLYNEHIKKQKYSDNEIYDLSKTLAYSKNYDVESI